MILNDQVVGKSTNLLSYIGRSMFYIRANSQNVTTRVGLLCTNHDHDKSLLHRVLRFNSARYVSTGLFSLAWAEHT